MRVAIFLATLLTGSVSAIASATSITSPDHPRTFAYGEITWRQLFLEATRGGLMAPAATTHAGTNCSIFIFPVSDSILVCEHSSPLAAVVR